jgi:hypothetical protein
LREIGQAPRLSGKNTLPPTIVIALDQGEELFNEEGRDEAERFIEILTNTLKADPRTLAIFAMRSDSFPWCKRTRASLRSPRTPLPST